MNPDSSHSVRPSHATVDLRALIANVIALKSAAPASKIMAVVKANAYGHGVARCAQALEECSEVYAFGVAIGEEGLELRALGIKKRILVFGGIFSEQLAPFISANLSLTGSSVEKLEAISQAAVALGQTAKVHLKIDTGMGRIGVRPASAVKLFERAKSLPALELEGVYTHFADADAADLDFTRQQLESFLAVRKSFQTIFGAHHPALFHAANSAAILRFPDSHLDMVRPGLSLYGVLPENSPPIYLEKFIPVLSLYSKGAYFKVVTKGQSVSYGRTWFASSDVRVMTVAIGYGDGYQRALSNRAEVIIRGKRFPVIGRICMDQMMVSIGLSEAYVGDVVTLIGGSQGEKRIRVEELAEWAGTIAYELLVQLNARVPRIYIK